MKKTSCLLKAERMGIVVNHQWCFCFILLGKGDRERGASTDNGGRVACSPLLFFCRRKRKEKHFVKCKIWPSGWFGFRLFRFGSVYGDRERKKVGGKEKCESSYAFVYVVVDTYSFFLFFFFYSSNSI